MLAAGEPPKFEVLDDLTVRYTWSKPNRFFIPALAAANQLFIYRPAHYLKQFHQKYADPEALKKLMEADGARDWVQLFLRKDRLNDFDDPDNPTLQPWMLTTSPPAQRFVAVRNPYFHRVDEQGPAAPLYRQVHPRHRRRQADPDQDRRRRGRSAGAPAGLQGLHLPQGERGHATG